MACCAGYSALVTVQSSCLSRVSLSFVHSSDASVVRAAAGAALMRGTADVWEAVEALARHKLEA